MKRNAKQAGSGGRLRLGLLLATAAAFLLVPASQAAAEHGEPHLKVNITAEPGASGEVASDTGTTFPGTPPIECNYPVGGPQEGICENAMEPLVNPFTGETVEWRVALEANVGPETRVGGWELVGGEVLALCGGSGEETDRRCSVATANETEDVEVNVHFELEQPQLKLNLIGVEGGGGEVISPGEHAPIPGTPPMGCSLAEGDEGPAEQTGVCENEMEGSGGEFAESLESFAGPNSEIEKWEFVSGGIPFGSFCEPGQSQCTALSAGEDVELDVYFACEEGKECPEAPPVPKLKLNLIGVEGGGGEVISPGEHANIPGTPPMECSLAEGAEGPAEQTGVCENEMEGGGGEFAESLEAFSAPNSQLGEVTTWEVVSGGFAFPNFCEPGQSQCTVLSAGEDVEMNVYFECQAGEECPPTLFPLNISTLGSGSGTVECDVNSGGLGACPAEVEKGSAVEVVATPDGISTLDALTGTGAAEGMCSSTEAGGTCTFTMTEPSSVSAEFNLNTYPLTLTPIEEGGTGSFECDINGGGLGACPAEVTHGDEVEVVASAGAESEVNSISGTGTCEVAEDRQSGTCAFTVSGPSAVEAEFVSEGKIAKDPGTVEGTVPIETTLETVNCDNVDLGPFVPSASEEEYVNSECTLTVTATGTENELRAADETGGLGGTDQTGHLTQEPTDPFTLNKALEVQGEGTTGGASPNPSGFLSLSGPATIQDYGTPVSLDTVTVTFRQLIEAFEPLHTGTYSKTITLTLEQDVL